MIKRGSRLIWVPERYFSECHRRSRLYGKCCSGPNHDAFITIQFDDVSCFNEALFFSTFSYQGNTIVLNILKSNVWFPFIWFKWRSRSPSTTVIKVQMFDNKHRRILLSFIGVSLFLASSISRFPKHGEFFSSAQGESGDRRRDEGASPSRPDHRRCFVYIATTTFLSTWGTDFCFDALVLGSVLILASGHISSCKVCLKNKLCL